MADSDAVVRSDVVALAARVRELEAQLIRTSLFVKAGEGDTNDCTHCNTNGCTNCRGDRFVDVLMPGEEVALSGNELVSRLRATRSAAK
jgi:hypothetical protein